MTIKIQYKLDSMRTIDIYIHHDALQALQSTALIPACSIIKSQESSPFVDVPSLSDQPAFLNQVCKAVIAELKPTDLHNVIYIPAIGEIAGTSRHQLVVYHGGMLDPKLEIDISAAPESKLEPLETTPITDTQLERIFDGSFRVLEKRAQEGVKKIREEGAAAFLANRDKKPLPRRAAPNSIGTPHEYIVWALENAACDYYEHVRNVVVGADTPEFFAQEIAKFNTLFEGIAGIDSSGELIFFNIIRNSLLTERNGECAQTLINGLIYQSTPSYFGWFFVTPTLLDILRKNFLEVGIALEDLKDLPKLFKDILTLSANFTKLKHDPHLRHDFNFDDDSFAMVPCMESKIDDPNKLGVLDYDLDETPEQVIDNAINDIVKYFSITDSALLSAINHKKNDSLKPFIKNEENQIKTIALFGIFCFKKIREMRVFTQIEVVNSIPRKDCYKSAEEYITELSLWAKNKIYLEKPVAVEIRQEEEKQREVEAQKQQLLQQEREAEEQRLLAIQQEQEAQQLALRLQQEQEEQKKAAVAFEPDHSALVFPQEIQRPVVEEVTEPTPKAMEPEQTLDLAQDAAKWARILGAAEPKMLGSNEAVKSVVTDPDDDYVLISDDGGIDLVNLDKPNNKQSQDVPKVPAVVATKTVDELLYEQIKSLLITSGSTCQFWKKLVFIGGTPIKVDANHTVSVPNTIAKLMDSKNNTLASLINVAKDACEKTWYEKCCSCLFDQRALRSDILHKFLKIISNDSFSPERKIQLLEDWREDSNFPEDEIRVISVYRA